MSVCPELVSIEAELVRAGLAAARAILSDKAEADMQKAYAQSLSAQQKRDALLAAQGLPIHYLQPDYSCEKCEDRGFSEGRLCDCVKKRACELSFAALNLKAPLADCGFDRFSLDYYNGDARPAMQTVVEYCRRYAENFEPGCGNLLLLGRTGLGKTHLSLAIAKEVITKGFSVIYGSALNVLHQVEREHFGREENGNTMDRLCGCDLLILDDLGAEYASPFITSAVYNVINTRLLEKKPLVISTNLSPAELERRYGERVVSRFISEYTPLQFAGEDVRQKKALERKTK